MGVSKKIVQEVLINCWSGSLEKFYSKSPTFVVFFLKKYTLMHQKIVLKSFVNKLRVFARGNSKAKFG